MQIIGGLFVSNGKKKKTTEVNPLKKGSKLHKKKFDLDYIWLLQLKSIKIILSFL